MPLAKVLARADLEIASFSVIVTGGGGGGGGREKMVSQTDDFESNFTLDCNKKTLYEELF